MLNREYLKEAGLRESDLPPANHPLLENDEEVRNLSDLITVRSDHPQVDIDMREIDSDDDLNVSEALTFPHKPRDAAMRKPLPDVTDFDADARTASAPDDEDDASYMTRADFEASMEETDPDPNTGSSASEFIGDAGIDRAPDMTGTVRGIAPGMATHLPLDATGFQIEDPELLSGDPRLEEDENLDIRGQDRRTDPGFAPATDDGADSDADGGRIPTRATNPSSHDDALDATRRIR